MAQVYNIPVTRALTNTGKVGVGFKKFFFKTNTTTKKSIFADGDLVTPLPNPITSDANGYYPQVFMEGTGDDYKVVFTDDTDADPPTSPIWTADPVEKEANDINAFAVRPAQHWGTTTGSATVYKITPNPAISSYNSNLIFTIQIHTDNTGSATFEVADLNNPGGFLAPLTAKKYDGAGGKVNLEPADVKANQTYLCRIDSTNIVFLNPESQNLNIMIGASVAFNLETPPIGFLEEDGSAISRTTFAPLFAKIGVRFGIGDGSTTFNIPDLRGEFIRGWSNGSAADPDRASRTDSGDGTTGDNVGTKQSDQIQSHNHSSGSFGPRPADGTANVFVTTDNAFPVINTGSTGGNETRPRNVYKMWCIKF